MIFYLNNCNAQVKFYRWKECSFSTLTSMLRVCALGAILYPIIGLVQDKIN